MVLTLCSETETLGRSTFYASRRRRAGEKAVEQLQEDGVGLGPESSTSRKSAFVCPIDKQALWPEQDSLACRTCGTRFPIVNGVPVLINDQNSVFQVADYLGAAAYK